MAEEYDPAFPTGDDDDDEDEIVKTSSPVPANFDITTEEPIVEGHEVVILAEGDEICDDDDCNFDETQLHDSFMMGGQETVVSCLDEECDDSQNELQLSRTDSEDNISNHSPLTEREHSLGGEQNQLEQSLVFLRNSKKQTQEEISKSIENFNHVFHNVCGESRLTNKFNSDSDSTQSHLNYSSDSNTNDNVCSKDAAVDLNPNLDNTTKSNNMGTPLLERLRDCFQLPQVSNDNSESSGSVNSKIENASGETSFHLPLELENSLKERQTSDSSQKESSDDNDNSLSTTDESQVHVNNCNKGKRKKSLTKYGDGAIGEKCVKDLPVCRRSSRIKSLEEKKEREREEKEREERERYERQFEDKCQPDLDKNENEFGKIEETKENNDDCVSCFVKPGLIDAGSPRSSTESKTDDDSIKFNKESPQILGTPLHEDFSSPKPEKVKSRWRRSSEMEHGEFTPPHCRNLNDEKSIALHQTSSTTHSSHSINPEACEEQMDSESSQDSRSRTELKFEDVEKCPNFAEISENVYLSERRRNKSNKEVRRMLCDCTITKEELIRDVVACGEDCLNRLLMIECSSRCPTGDYCTNKRFQKQQYKKVEPFKTEFKGWGLRCHEDIPEGTFIMEYVGEVLDPREFKRRVKEYAREKNRHYYFMALKSDEIIDATKMGNTSRFINHSCSPNCETQKWTINGELRIGFFSRTSIKANEELTFDYQFQRYGKEAQKCYCMSEDCRGYIGGEKQTPLKRERSTPKRRKTAEEIKREYLEDMDLEEEIEKLSVNGGLRNRDQTLTLSRLMIRAEDSNSRLGLLKILQKTTEQACLRLFLDYHGLSLVWSWMVDVANSEDNIELKTQILQTLQILPITNKTMLMDSRVMAVVQRWAEQIEEFHQLEKEKDRDSETADSEPPSQVTTPRHSDGSETEKISISAQQTSNRLQAVAEDSSSSYSEDNEIDTKKPDLENGSINHLVLETNSSPEVIHEQASTCLEFMHTTTEKNDCDQARMVPTIDFPENQNCDSHIENCCENMVSQKESEIDELENNLLSDNAKESQNISNSHSNSLESIKDDNLRLDNHVTEINDENVHPTFSNDVNMEEVFDVKNEVNGPFYDEFRNGDIPAGLDETVEMISNFVNDQALQQETKVIDEKLDESQTTEIQDSNTNTHDKGEDQEMTESKPDDEIDSITNGLKENQIANLAVKLLESWSNLKEAYRIPKREQNQNRREHEREADRHELELNYGTDYPDSNSENDYGEKTKDRGRDSDRRDRYQDRDQEKQDNDRKHGHSSPDKEFWHFNEKKLRLDDSDSPESKPKRRSRNARLNHGMLPPPPRLSKEERRHLFELKVQQEEAEEAIRKQHEEFVRQHEALLMDPSAGPPAVFYDPNFAQPYFDPNAGGYLPPIPLPAPVDGSIIEPPVAFDPSQPNLVYPQGVVYPGQPPPFLPPGTPTQVPPANHYVAPSPTPPVYYPTAPAPPAVIHLSDQTTTVPAWSQSHLLSLLEEAPPPPEPPAKPKPVKLPPNWKTAKDAEGRVYYYHSVTRQTQWEPPSWDPSEENDMDLGTPTYDEPKVRKRKLKSKKKLTTTAAADTSSELVKRTKELFRTKMSQFIVQCLNPYRKPDCKIGRITCTEDFKHLARKLTHFVMAKELKYCRNIEELECNDNVKHKAKDFVKKYMQKFGSSYRKTASPKDDIE